MTKTEAFPQPEKINPAARRNKVGKWLKKTVALGLVSAIAAEGAATAGGAVKNRADIKGPKVTMVGNTARTNQEATTTPEVFKPHLQSLSDFLESIKHSNKPQLLANTALVVRAKPINPKAKFGQEFMHYFNPTDNLAEVSIKSGQNEFVVFNPVIAKYGNSDWVYDYAYNLYPNVPPNEIVDDMGIKAYIKANLNAKSMTTAQINSYQALTQRYDLLNLRNLEKYADVEVWTLDGQKPELVPTVSFDGKGLTQKSGVLRQAPASLVPLLSDGSLAFKEPGDTQTIWPNYQQYLAGSLGFIRTHYQIPAP